MSCPTGYHPRRAYTVRRTGTKVRASCVRATTKAGPRSVFLAKTKRRMTRRLQGVRRSVRGPRRCAPGTILRNPYVRERKGRRTLVPASCIRNVGNPGKGLASAPGGGPGIGPLRKGDLSRFGYDHVTSMSEGRRHLALASAVRAYGSLTVWRKLNAIYVYTRNTSPASSAILKADRDWINAHYGIKAFPDNV